MRRSFVDLAFYQEFFAQVLPTYGVEVISEDNSLHQIFTCWHVHAILAGYSPTACPPISVERPPQRPIIPKGHSIPMSGDLLTHDTSVDSYWKSEME